MHPEASVRTEPPCVEKTLKAPSGWAMLVVVLILLVAQILSLVRFISLVAGMPDDAPLPTPAIVTLTTFVLLIPLIAILCSGFFTLQPGQARVCVLFGKYVGTVREGGFHWANPFFSHNLSVAVGAYAPSNRMPRASEGEGAGKARSSKISLRARTHEGERIKVNDKMGNPIEIATVVVWHVADTAKAVFDVDDYESYVSMQVETGLRHVASVYSYDHMEDDDASTTDITLRSNIEEVSDALKQELSRKLVVAGVTVDDARLTHLAYAPEIAQAMLRRQQADAIIAARKKIVEGAVSMVDMALTQLSEGGIVDFDDDRKAVMASNLMVVLCGESEAQPVVNTGSLYA